jgi:hypothetical protein
MNAEVENIFNQETIDAAANAAFEGFKAKHPDASQEQLDLALVDIKANILSSRTKDKFLNSKANRDARKAHVLQVATDAGVAFAAVKQTVLVPFAFEPGEQLLNKASVFAMLLEDVISLLGIEEPVERIVTFAFKADDLGDGFSRLTYSLSAQNPKDVQDGLIGKEYAISRFVEGKTRVTYISTEILSGLGANRVFRDGIRAGVVEKYTEQYL